MQIKIKNKNHVFHVKKGRFGFLMLGFNSGLEMCFGWDCWDRDPMANIHPTNKILL